MSKPIALVTGGSRGRGRATVEELRASHHVVATYNSNRAAAQSVAAETGVEIVQCQRADLASCRGLAEEVATRFGSVDLLVNNAGMPPRQRRDILDATSESFDELFATNLRGPYFLTQQIARSMLARSSGRIVFIGFISSFTASLNRGDYCMTKAALSMAVKLFAHGLLLITSACLRFSRESSAPI